jgi:ArsR family transcriptional regulator
VGDLEGLFKGLADRTRLRIMNLLLRGELCVCDIQFVLGSPQPNISRHLAYLKHSGLVLDRREGQRMFYRLPDADDPTRKQLFALLRETFRASPEFALDARILKEAIAQGSCSVSEPRRRSARRRHRRLRAGRV